MDLLKPATSMRIHVCVFILITFILQSCGNKKSCTEYISNTLGFVKVTHDSIYTVCFGQSPVELEYRSTTISGVTKLIGDYDTLIIDANDRADIDVIRLVKGNFVEEFRCVDGLYLNNSWNVATILMPAFDAPHSGEIIVDKRNKDVLIFIGGKELFWEPKNTKIDDLFNEITLLNSLPSLTFAGEISHSYEIKYIIRDGSSISVQSTIHHLPLKLSELRTLVKYLNDQRSLSE